MMEVKYRPKGRGQQTRTTLTRSPLPEFMAWLEGVIGPLAQFFVVESAESIVL
jgi:hypothetical protein